MMTHSDKDVGFRHLIERKESVRKSLLESHSLRQQVLTAEKFRRSFPRNTRKVPIFSDNSLASRTAENGLLS
jgi:hypothetical protein